MTTAFVSGSILSVKIHTHGIGKSGHNIITAPQVKVVQYLGTATANNTLNLLNGYLGQILPSRK